MSDVVRIRYHIETDATGSTCSDVIEFDRQEWEAMTENERMAEMKEHAFNHVDWGYREVTEHDEGTGDSKAK